jgi:CheY-like chemotaxis protein
MSSPSEPESTDSLANPIAKAASELNNLLQIISGTSALIQQGEESDDSSEKYLAMLRTSIERAEKVASALVQQAGGPKEKTLVNPELAPFIGSKKTQDPTKRKQSILIVDDEPMALTLIQRILTEAGYHVVTAQSGFECLDLFRKCPSDFDLILLDLTMPFMDGEETFGKLREVRANMPVVFCTGFIQQERLKRLMDLGLTGFLRKPIAPDEIVSLVRSVLQSIKYSRGKLNADAMPAVI